MKPFKEWVRSEYMEMARPALALDENNPGSDVAAETAAALAAAAILFSDEANGCHILFQN